MKKEFSTLTVKGYGNLAKIAKSFIESGKNIIVFNVHRTSLEEDFMIEIEWLIKE